MQLRDALFSSESVTEGHPDKICDQVSDAVLDECLRQDKHSRVALETAVKTGLVVLLGEITTAARLDYPAIVRRTVERIGFNDGSMGFDSRSCGVMVAVEPVRSPLIETIELIYLGSNDIFERARQSRVIYHLSKAISSQVFRNLALML